MDRELKLENKTVSLKDYHEHWFAEQKLEGQKIPAGDRQKIAARWWAKEVWKTDSQDSLELTEIT